MDATARWSSSRVHRALVLIVLVCASLLIGVSHNSEETSFVRHDGHNNFLFRREENLTSLGINSTNAPVPPLVSSSMPGALGPASSSSSNSGLSSFTLSSQRSGSPSISSNVSSSSSSHSSSASFSPPSSSSSHSSSTEILSSTSHSSPSAQSSISSPLSSTQPVATRASPITEVVALSAATTLALTDYSAPTTVDISPSPSSTSEVTGPTNVSSALTSSSFWQKKGAVAATFVIISLVVVAIITILSVHFVKRRNARKEAQLHEELFEKYSDPDHRSSSPGPSINGTPMDAFAGRDIRHDNGSPYDNYQTPTTTPTFSQSSFPVQHPDYYNTPPSRYLAPSQVQASARKPVPTAFQDPHPHSDARASYQPSIDSFYGAAGQPSSYNP